MPQGYVGVYVAEAECIPQSGSLGTPLAQRSCVQRRGQRSVPLHSLLKSKGAPRQNTECRNVIPYSSLEINVEKTWTPNDLFCSWDSARRISARRARRISPTKNLQRYWLVTGWITGAHEEASILLYRSKAIAIGALCRLQAENEKLQSSFIQVMEDFYLPEADAVLCCAVADSTMRPISGDLRFSNLRGRFSG
jgi:hypothetical protein